MPALPCRLLQGCAALLALALWAVGAGRLADPVRSATAERPQAVAPAVLAEDAPAVSSAPSARSGGLVCAREPVAASGGYGAAPQPRLRMGSALGARAP